MGIEELLCSVDPALNRFVRFRIQNRHDADDVLQETRLAAFRNFDPAMDEERFRAWIIGIARHKCADHFRKRTDDVPLDEVPEGGLVMSRVGLVNSSPVEETLEELGPRDREILKLHYFDDMKVSDIAVRLGIAEGTVKSRLDTARRHFKNLYPYPPKGANDMFTKLPETMPEYKIVPSEEEPFPVKWEEIMGWFIVPKPGEKLEWAMYDFPKRSRTEYVAEEVTGRAEVHGVEGVSVLAKEYEPVENDRIDGRKYNERRFVAQLTDTHCRLLAEAHEEDGVMKYYTFLDGGEFLNNWGFGEDNCGNETDIAPKGDITRNGSAVFKKDEKEHIDVVGRYTVTIGGKAYDTVCVMDVDDCCGSGVATEQYLDRNGRTVLWRRFNRNDWRYSSYGKLWTEMFPENETITVNGETFVHWYDCITDRVM